MGLIAASRQDAADTAGWAVMSGRDLIGGLHPRTRLVMTLVALLAVTVVHNPVVLGMALVGAVTLVWLGRLPWTSLRHRLLHVEGFLIALLILLPFTVPGDAVFSLGPFAATAQGLSRALLVVVKVNICALTIFALLGTLDPVLIGQAAEGIGVPPRFVTLFLFTVRYVSVFRAETARLRDAMRSRGFVPGTNLHTMRTFGDLAGMMVVRSLERAQRVDEAMRCRGFAGRLPAGPLVATRRRDVAVATVFAGAIVGLLMLEFRT